MLLASIPGNMQAWIHFLGKVPRYQVPNRNMSRRSSLLDQYSSRLCHFQISFILCILLSISRIDWCSQKHLNNFFESMQMKPLHQGRIRLYTCRSNICISRVLVAFPCIFLLLSSILASLSYSLIAQPNFLSFLFHWFANPGSGEMIRRSRIKRAWIDRG